MAEQSTTFFVFSLQLFDFSTHQKNKIHFGFTLFPKNDFQNGAVIQYGVFKIFSTLIQLP
jgi:hypothetical protein